MNEQKLSHLCCVDFRMAIAIIGHWGSCNMGDRYQPLVVYRYLIDRLSEGSKIYCINFSGDNGNKMTFEFDGHTINLYEPLDIESGTVISIDHAILTTGSMDNASPYVGWITKMLQMLPSLKTLIVWGGFSRGYNPLEIWVEGLNFLCDRRVIYFARSYADLECYHSIINFYRLKENDFSPGDHGQLAGDPLCLWVTDYISHPLTLILSQPLGCSVPQESILSQPNAQESIKPLTGIVAIVSVHCFEYERYILWDKIVDMVNSVVCIDTYGDQPVLIRHPSAIITNEPWTLIALLSKATHVISGRLHGAVISSCLNIPTTLIAIDDPEPGMGSFKFEAVGNTATGPNSGICKVYNASYVREHLDEMCKTWRDTSLTSKFDVNVTEYIRLTGHSLDTICDLLRLSTFIE